MDKAIGSALFGALSIGLLWAVVMNTRKKTYILLNNFICTLCGHPLFRAMRGLECPCGKERAEL